VDDDGPLRTPGRTGAGDAGDQDVRAGVQRPRLGHGLPGPSVLDIYLRPVRDHRRFRLEDGHDLNLPIG